MTANLLIITGFACGWIAVVIFAVALCMAGGASDPDREYPCERRGHGGR